MLIRSFVILLVFLVAFACKKDKMVSEQPYTINIDKNNFITAKVGENVNITASVSIKGDFSYEWKIGNETVSKANKLSLQLTQPGLHLFELNVTSPTKQTKTKKMEIFVGKKTNYKVVGYFPYYNDKGQAAQMRWENLTHLCYAFLEVNADGSVNDSKINNKIQTVVNEAHKNDVYVMISLGGGGTHSFSDALLNKPARDKLVANVVDFVNKNKLDGVDVDFEEWDGGTDGASADDLKRRTELESFYKELKESLPKDKYLSVAVSSSWKNPYFGYYNCYTESMHKYWDFAGIMIYDQTGTWDSSPYGQHSGMDHLKLSVNHWLNNMKLPKTKLIAGVPFYGYRFKSQKGGAAEGVSYKDIISQYPGEDVTAKDHIGNIFYNGIPTIKEKCGYVKSKGLGGVMIWELTQDSKKKSESLLETIGKSILR